MSGPELIITLATHRDAAGGGALLTQSRLPISDLVSSQPEFVVAHAGGELVGIGAIESLGAAGLLRSVAVIPPRRKSGLGRDIVQRLERLARKAGIGWRVPRIYRRNRRDCWIRMSARPPICIRRAWFSSIACRGNRRIAAKTWVRFCSRT